MRVPPFERYVRGMQFLGVLLAGMMIGAAALNAMHAGQFEALYNEGKEMEAKLQQYEQDIKHLKYYKSEHTVIKSIVLRIEDEGGARPRLDRLAEAELLKRVKEDLSILVGQSIYEIDSDARIARKLLDKKIYSDVFGKDYTIQLTTVLLADNVLQVWMVVRPYAKPPA
jgi:hypothetical protein